MASSHARHLRAHLTDAERVLWRYLRASRLCGYKFRRQAPIGRYIVDFVCFEMRLIIELDGGQHAERTRYESDRTAWLRGQGFRVLRFWNTDVLNNMEGVREVIAEACAGEPPLPNPPPRGGGDDEKGRAVGNAFRLHSLGRRTPRRLDTPAEFWHLSPQSRPVVRAFDGRATGSEEGGSPSFSCMQRVCGACTERIDTRQSGGPSAWLARKSP